MLQRLQQSFGIIFHRLNAESAENLREGPLHHLAVLDDVRDTRRATQIVFENIELSVGIANQVGPYNVTPHVAGGLQSQTLLEIARSREDQLGRHDTVFKNSLFVVDIVDEQVQREDSLPQPALDHREFGSIDDPRHDVERPNFFGPRFVAVNGKRDSHVEQRQIRRLLPSYQLPVGECDQALGQRIGSRTRTASFVEHLVVEPIGLVIVQPHVFVPQLWSAGIHPRFPCLRLCTSAFRTSPAKAMKAGMNSRTPYEKQPAYRSVAERLNPQTDRQRIDHCP